MDEGLQEALKQGESIAKVAASPVALYSRPGDLVFASPGTATRYAGPTPFYLCSTTLKAKKLTLFSGVAGSGGATSFTLSVKRADGGSEILHSTVLGSLPGLTPYVLATLNTSLLEGDLLVVTLVPDPGINLPAILAAVALEAE